MQLVEDDGVEARNRKRGASACDSSSAICSGVVSRMSGGRGALALPCARPTCRRVRVSTRIGSCICSQRGEQVARHVDGQRLQRRHVERVHACAPRWPLAPATAPPGSAGSRPASCPSRSARSAGSSGARRPSPAGRAGARAAASRGCRTRPGRPAAGQRVPGSAVDPVVAGLPQQAVLSRACRGPP